MTLVKASPGDPWGLGASRSTLVVGSIVDWINQQAINIREAAYGADPTGSTDSSPAMALAYADAVSSSRPILMPPGTYRWNSQLAISSPVMILGSGASDRWRGARPTKIDYRGSGSAIAIQPSAGILDSVSLAGFSVDGTNASASTDGLLIAQGSGTAVEGVLVEDVSITNFPRYQVSHTGLVFDVTYRRLNANDKDRTGDNVVNIASAAGGPGQILFDDCFLVGYGAGKWIVYSAGPNMRFIGGTVAAGNGTGVNGIRGPFTLTLTHVEGVSNLGVGLRRVTSLGGIVFPELLNTWATGLQIGDPGNASADARGTIIGGAIGGNTTDIHIVAGGTRAGTTILPVGRVSGAPTITNDRETTDSVLNEVIYLLNDAGSIDFRGVSLSAVLARVRDRGTGLSAGDFALGGNWGTSPSVASVAAGSSDGKFKVMVNSGTGSPGADPTLTLTFKDGTWTNPPFAVVSRGDANAPSTGVWLVTGTTATTLTLTFKGTPQAATSYVAWVQVVGT